VRAFGLVGDGHGDAGVRIVAVGGEGFRAVENQLLPLRTAVLRVPPASEPASGSVSDHAPSFFPCARGDEVLAFLLFGAEFIDVIAAQRIVGGDE